MPEHKDITDPNIHEVKGASTASVGQVLTATGSGTATFQPLPTFSTTEVGTYRIVNNSATPVSLTAADTFYSLTNDGLGAGTTAVYGIDGVPGVWVGSSTNQLSLSDFEVGDSLIIYADVELVTSEINTAVDIEIEFGIGGSVFSIPLITKQNIKTASTTRLVSDRYVFLRDSNICDYPARFKAKADSTGATIKVNEFVVGVFVKG